MTHNTYSFEIKNTKFYGQYWTAKNTKAVVVLVHGMGEHSSRYEHVVQELNEAGFSVVAFDHFGHGKTTGKRGHNPGYEYVLESVSKAIEKATSLFPKIPVFLYGHSMGGNAVINFALTKDENISGVIASSAFLKLAFEPPKIKLSAGKILQKIAPSITMGNELNPEDISRDKKAVQEYINDPLVHDKISPNFSLSFIDKGKWAIDNANLLKVPVLMIHGTDDHIIDYKGSVAFAKNTALAAVKLYDGGYHELHHDLCKEEVIQDVVKWLNEQV